MSKSTYFTGQLFYNLVIYLLDREEIIKISHSVKGSEAYVKRFDGYQHLIVVLLGVINHLLYLSL